MKEELNEKLVEILSSIQSAAGKASDFALEQLPDIAQSYVFYARVTTVVSSSVLMIMSIVAGCIAFWAFKNPWNNSSYSCDRDLKRSDSNHMAMLIPGFFSALFLFLSFASFNWLVWLAPKVWLLKELANMVK